MSHTPYGYRIENGQAVIDKAAATIIRRLYKNYLSGMSLSNAAKEAGIKVYHGTAKKIMLNKHYLGDNFYPAIIGKEIFDAVSDELKRRASKLGRLNTAKAAIIKPVPTHFQMKQPELELPNPIKQAEYLYSLIELEVTANASR